MQYISEKQNQHLIEMRKKRPENWRNTKGAPTKEKIVKLYRMKHPEATMYRCSKDTGMSINTVRKWWHGTKNANI